MSQLVAVYGTLKRGYGNHHWAERDGAVFVGEGRTEDKFTMYDGGFPMVTSKGGDSIGVEVFAIPDEPVNMDMLEGHPSHFKREEVLVELSGIENPEVEGVGYKIVALMYLYQHPTEGLTRLPEGMWKGRV